MKPTTIPRAARPARFPRFAAVCLSLSSLVGIANAAPLEPKDISVEKELLVTSTDVVDSDDERFSLKTVLTGLSPDGNPKTALLGWMRAWGLPEARSPFVAWKAADGAGALTFEQWTPNFDNAPFRLLAVVNRLDLQRRDVDGIPLHAGEGRFVFCVTSGPGRLQQSPALLATVIFEYAQPARSESQVLEWALAWRTLNAFSTFDKNYRDALAAVTAKFTTAAISLPIGGKIAPLNQIRTNEIALTGGVWKLREFRLDPVKGTVFSARTKQNPSESLATDPLVAGYINDHLADIRAQRHVVPRKYLGREFLASESQVATAGSVIWKPSGVPADARYLFAFNTCSGCHGVEAQTSSFTHLAPRARGGETSLSPFLRNQAPIDQAVPGKPVEHPELKEIDARKTIMAEVLNGRPPEKVMMGSLDFVRQTKGPSPEVLALLETRANREH